MAIEHKTNHVAEGLGQLIEVLKDKPKIRKFLTVFLNQIQDLEDAFLELLIDRALDEAVGAQLDGLGSIVGEFREGRNDTDYRLAIRVRIQILLNEATPQDLIEIFVNSTGKAVQLREYFAASFTLELFDPVDPSWDPVPYGAILQTTKPAGVNAQLLYHIEDPFRFDTGPGFDEGHYGGAIGG
ncbi:MAG: hypothetical protein GWM98_04680 [Nitrospinaceae bacterium]|nr:hypothetical protein [Deltaproteobacteria bacterium]NIY14215.1 hypothetical protein [Nitrospinaceae bacterium]